MSFQINENSINQIGKILANDYEEQKLLDFQNTVIKAINGQYSLLKEEFDKLNSEIGELKALLENSDNPGPKKTPEKIVKVKGSTKVRKSSKFTKPRKATLSLSTPKGEHLYSLMCLASEDKLTQLDYTTLRFKKRSSDMKVPISLVEDIYKYFNTQGYSQSLTLTEITKFYNANPKLAKNIAWTPNTLCVYYKSSLQMLTKLGFLRRRPNKGKSPSTYRKTEKSFPKIGRILEY